MLQSIRDRTQGWIAGIIISILILSFSLWGIHSYLEGGSATSTIAKVDGFEITKSQLAVAYERLRRQIQIQNSSSIAMPAAEESLLKDRALQTLINIQVLKQASIKQGYRVSDRQVDGLLESMPDFQVNGRFSLARFQQVLSTTLFNAVDFLNLLKTSLLIDQPRLGLLLTSFALSDEINNAVSLVKQERAISYALISPQTLLSQPVAISHDKIESYYNAHQDDFKTPEQVSIDYLELSVNNLMSALNPNDAELKTFYNENTSLFAQPMQWKLAAIFIPVAHTANESDIKAAESKVNEIQKKVSAGSSLTDFAKQFPVGKELGVLNGWVSLSQVPQGLQKSVMSLNKVKQVGSPIKVTNGYILLQAEDIKEAKAQPFENVKDKVKDNYVHQLAEEKFASLKDKLANSTYEHPDSLKYAADLLSLPIKSTGMFTKDKGGKDLSGRSQVRDAAFSNEVLVQHNNSDVIQLGSDTVIVLRIKSHIPATLLSLNAVENQINDKLKAQEEEVQAAKMADAISNKLSASNNTQELTNQYHLSWVNAGYIGRHATKVDTGILNKAFSMPKPQANKVVYSVVKVQNGYAIIALRGVIDGTLDKNHEEFDVFSEQLQNAQGMLDYELYKESMMTGAKIQLQKVAQSPSE